MTDDVVIDLDAERKQRAAAREGAGKEMPIRLGGETIAVLPVELPIDVLTPLRDIDDSITLLLRSAMQAQRTNDSQQRWDATELIVDLLAATPTLPRDVLNVLGKVGENLLGTEGLAKLLAYRPSGQDYAALAKGVFRFYGLTLGEVSPPSGSSTSGGATSSTTSKPTSTDSTPAASTPNQAAPGSSESAAS